MAQVGNLPPSPQSGNLLGNGPLGRPRLRNSAGISLSVAVRCSKQTTGFGLERNPALPLVPISGVVASDGEGQHCPGRFLLLEGKLPLGRPTLPGSNRKSEFAGPYSASGHRKVFVYWRRHERLHAVVVKSIVAVRIICVQTH